MKDATLCVATPAINTHGFASLSVAALLEDALDALELFSIGASCSATVWEGGDAVLRISVGLEAREDLEADVGRLLAVLEQSNEHSAQQ